jgi:PAS domain S-box-containing protein
MDTSFNHNQNLPASGFENETAQNCQCLKQRLEATEARIRCLLATLPEIVWFAEVNGAIAHFNQRWYEYTGLSELESLGWGFLKALHPEDRDRFVSSYPLASIPPQRYEIECRLLDRHGSYRWFSSRKTPVMGENGQVLEWIGTYTLKEQPEQYLAAAWQDTTNIDTPQGNHSQLQVEFTPQLAVDDHPPAHLQVRNSGANNTVKLAQQRLRTLVNELSRAIVWEAEATTEQFTYVSQGAEWLLGYPVEQWLSQPDFWVNLIHPEDRQWTVALSRKELVQSRDYELEYRCLAADKRVVWLRDRAYVLRNGQGQVLKRRGLMVDITLAKQAEAQLQVRRCQQAVVAQLGQHMLLGTEISQLMDEAVSLVSQTLEVEYCQVLELLPDRNTLRFRAGVGWQQELVGEVTIDASPNTQAGYTLHCHQPVIVEDLHCETRFQGSPLLHDHNIVSGVSTIIDAAVNVQSWEGEANTVDRPFGVLGAYTSRRRRFTRSDTDFLQSVANVLGGAIGYQRTHDALYTARSQLAQTTAILKQTAATLDKRTQELDQFVYITSHDLKAPLRAIANLSEWIEEDIADQLHEENFRQMQLLRGRVYRLEGLIDGLLQYSRAGRLRTKPERVDVEALLRQVINCLTPPAEFTIEIAPGMPTLLTEQLPLQQVLTQLIDNAIKHHPSSNGRVKISAQEQGNTYEFAVTDDGAGIAPQFHERLFIIFQTLQARDTVENIGAGLAIAKKIVETRGGSIRLDSQEGQGATFYFTWPKLLSEKKFGSGE